MSFYVDFKSASLSLIGHRWLFKILIVLLSHPHLSGSSETERFQKLLNNFKATHLYNVESDALCPAESNTYIVGARVRLSNHLNLAKQLVTALEVICSDGITTRASGETTLVLDKNIGNWSEFKECPNGLFATDVVFNLEYVDRLELIAYSKFDHFTHNRLFHANRASFDVYSLLTDKFITGVTFNCSYRGDKHKLVPIYDDNHSGGRNPGAGSSFTVGQSTGYGLRIYCLRDRVISGLYLKKQALISAFDEERMIPVKMTIKCEEIFNPARNCHPELAWEQVGFDLLDCANPKNGKHLNSSLITDTDGHPTNISCKVRHSIGSTLNRKITNLNRILGAYRPTGMTTNIGAIIMPKLLTAHFRSDWVEKYKLQSSDYEKLVKDKQFARYLKYEENQVKTISFTNINHDFSNMSKLGRNIIGDDKVQRELVISQLVGYCSVYKIYFPLFQNEIQNFIRKDIDGIQRNILIE